MLRKRLQQTGTAALYLGLILSHFIQGSGIKVFSQPGQSVTLLCSYHYEDQVHIPQLSVQWRSPHNELLCHYIKHKDFQKCTPGYNIKYSPGSISLTIQQARPEDLGTHVCSVSKPHEFSDYRIELASKSESNTSAPMSGVNQSGFTGRLLVLHTFTCLLLCM
ncbi:uncharacterized protein KZ484_023155 [Pholidichthys leucotaenia]